MSLTLSSKGPRRLGDCVNTLESSSFFLVFAVFSSSTKERMGPNCLSAVPLHRSQGGSFHPPNPELAAPGGGEVGRWGRGGKSGFSLHPAQCDSGSRWMGERFCPQAAGNFWSARKKRQEVGVPGEGGGWQCVPPGCALGTASPPLCLLSSLSSFS